MRSWARAIEKRLLRPLGRILPRRGRETTAARIAGLERRVELLEGLIRELAGLAYLEMEADDHGGVPPKEAA